MIDYFRGSVIMTVAIDLPKEIANSLTGPDEDPSRIALKPWLHKVIPMAS